MQSSHVIPALILRASKRSSSEPSITAWGTGNATREFLYVEDAAEAVLIAAELYNKPDPVNIGSGSEISIRDLSEKIGSLTGYRGAVKWDAGQPDGQPRRSLDTSRALSEFGWRATTTLDEGLQETIDWFVRFSDEAVVEAVGDFLQGWDPRLPSRSYRYEPQATHPPEHQELLCHSARTT